MPGRQSHGRALLPASGPKKVRGPSSRARSSRALDAFSIAENEVPTRRPKGVRTRDLEEQPERAPKRQHDDDDDEDGDDDDEGDDDEADEPRKKKAKRGGDDDEFAGFSGSEDEEEWHVGVGSGDEDSDIDSDEAFGESDDEKFEGFAFSGSSSKKKGKKRGEEEEEEESDDESLGSDAIDLATALDQWSEGDEEEGEDGEEEEDEESEEESDSDDEEDPYKLDALQSMIAGFAGEEEDGEEESGPKQKAKLSLADLGLAGVKDPHIKKSLKLMNKEEKTKPGARKKLDVPLAKRQQDKVLRSAAYEKTSETLDRWIDTVKSNRRADHLFFPLAQNAHDRGLDAGELMPITAKTSGTELEQTILAIMEESGLGPRAKAEDKEDGEAKPGLSQEEQMELTRQRRRQREEHSREAVRAKRIKKIKSRAYRRVHRKELARDAQNEHDEKVATGEIDSEDEREAQDRRRALERVGTRHRESKWAKLGKKGGRAVWDDNFRSGLTEMAQRNDELRKRVEGRTGGSDDDDDEDDDMSDASGDSDANDKRRLLEQLERANEYESEAPKKGLMAMKFMQRGEAEIKKANDELVAQLRRELGSDPEDEEDEEMDIGRRQYGMGKTAKNPFLTASAAKKLAGEGETAKTTSKPNGAKVSAPVRERSPSPVAPAAGGWSRSEKKSKVKVGAGELDLTNSIPALAVRKPTKPKSQQTATKEADSDDEDALHLPMAIRDQEMIKAAFGGEDVSADFEKEKAEVEKDDDDKEVDNTLPGWGGWVGEGISGREKRRHQGRFVTKVEGIKKTDRKDYKLKSVIISEKRIKKVCLGASELIVAEANMVNRTTSTSRRSCRSRSRASSSTRGRCVCRLGPSGAPRRRSRGRRSRGSLSSRASLRPCRSLWFKAGVCAVVIELWAYTGIHKIKRLGHVVQL